MKLELTLTLNICRSFKKGDSSMSDWSDDAARRFADQKKSKQVQNEKVLADQENLGLNGPKVWNELYELLRSQCAELNSNPSVGNILDAKKIDFGKIQINRTDNGSSLTLSFDPKRHTITLDGPGIIDKDKEMTLSVIEGTSQIQIKNKTKEPFTTEGIVKNSLEKLLEV